MAEFALVAFVLLLALGAWYSFVTFPKQRDFAKRQRLVSALAQGDEVITYGGIIGRVVDIEPEMGITYVEIADGLVVRMLTAAIMQLYDAEAIARSARKGLGLEDEVADTARI
jgi:preprotein translocase subunit YajC